MNILIPFHDPGSLTLSLHGYFPSVIEPVQFRRFPDGESYVRFTGQVKGHDVYVVAAPLSDDMLPGLWFLCDLLRKQAAGRITLLLPYLPYMRQDQAFQPGEVISARSFASLLSAMADRVVTVDPHLHRIPSLEDVFSVPVITVQAAPLISAFLRSHFPDALVIGPDIESKQWAAAVAGAAGLPYIICAKTRRGDREVEIIGEIPASDLGKTPVVVDDILSTGRTLGKLAAFLDQHGMRAPVCFAVHGICAGDALEFLHHSGFQQIFTTNTLPSPVARLDIAPVIADSLKRHT